MERHERRMLLKPNRVLLGICSMRRLCFAAAYLSLLWPAALRSDEKGRDMHANETVYNGIRLPAPWPPKVESLTLEPMSPPYLADPPAVIPIDVGRQLFVDDFLIEQTALPLQRDVIVKELLVAESTYSLKFFSNLLKIRFIRGLSLGAPAWRYSPYTGN